MQITRALDDLADAVHTTPGGLIDQRRDIIRSLVMAAVALADAYTQAATAGGG